ncbi:MAG: hypothetical protein CMM03_03700 [Rhodopirellula sp.]|nr:hypothetical protein [Rhodopirellula sp.]
MHLHLPIGCQELFATGSRNEAKTQLLSEAKDDVVEEENVIEFRFNVQVCHASAVYLVQLIE